MLEAKTNTNMTNIVESKVLLVWNITIIFVVFIQIFFITYGPQKLTEFAVEVQDALFSYLNYEKCVKTRLNVRFSNGPRFGLQT